VSNIRPTRRDVIRSIVAAGAGASALSLGHQHQAIAGVAPGRSGLTRLNQDAKVELTWAINALTGTEIELVQSVVDQFVAQNPNYDVTVLNYDPETYDQKLLTDISAGTLPDIFVSADVFAKPFFDANLTADLRPLAEATGFDLSLYDPNFLALSEVDGKIGFLPRGADVVVTYFNKRMFDEAGVAYPTDDWTYDDMLAAAEKLTIKAADGTTTQYGVDASYTWWAYWVPMVVAQGGQILNDDNSEAVFNSPEGISAWNIIFTGLQNGWFAPPSFQQTMGGEGNGFQAGKAAMTFTVRALCPTYRAVLQDDWDVALVPKGTASRKTGMGTMGYAISSKTKDPAATWKLLEYTFSDGMRFFMESYLVVPPISTFYDDPAWRDLPGPPYNNDIFVSATKDAMLPPSLPFYSTGAFKKAMEDGVDAVLLGQMSPEDAVNRMAQEATRSLRM
jgi:multiple sugar transport system substrate-binding protein